MDKILAQFGVQPVLLAAQVVNFLILLFILKKFLYGPILKVLQKRKDSIAQSLKNAEEIEKRLNALSEEEQKRILKAAEQGEKIIKEATETSVQIIEEGKKKYEDLMERAIMDAKNVAQVQQTKILQEIRKNLADIVSLALEKITDKVLTQKEKQEIIEKEVKNLS